jgi:predicted NBD/HSP70 family sugar kinase
MKIAAADIGGTAIKYGLVSDGMPAEVHEIPTLAQEGAKAVLKRTMDALETLPDFKAIGISTAGQVNRKNGRIIFANDNLPGFTGLPVRQIFERRFGVPAAVENDVNAAAIGEAAYGAAKGVKDFLMLTYGTGVGGAIFTDGKLYTGNGMSAGEFGGMVLHPEKMKENVIYSGCYENCASVTALVAAVQREHPELKDGRSIFRKIDEPSVKKAVDEWIFEAAAGLVSLIHIFNPETVILGGGIMEQDYVMDRIRLTVRPYLAGGFQNTEIRRAALGNRAGICGAAVSARELSRQTKEKKQGKRQRKTKEETV